MERHSHPSIVIVLSSDCIEAKASGEFGEFVASINLIAIRQRTTRTCILIKQFFNCITRRFFSKAWTFFLNCVRDALRTFLTILLVISMVLLAFPLLNWLNVYVFSTLLGSYLTQDQIQLIVDKLIDLAL